MIKLIFGCFLCWRLLGYVPGAPFSQLKKAVMPRIGCLAYTTRSLLSECQGYWKASVVESQKLPRKVLVRSLRCWTIWSCRGTALAGFDGRWLLFWLPAAGYMFWAVRPSVSYNNTKRTIPRSWKLWQVADSGMVDGRRVAISQIGAAVMPHPGFEVGSTTEWLCQKFTDIWDESVCDLRKMSTLIWRCRTLWSGEARKSQDQSVLELHP